MCVLSCHVRWKLDVLFRTGDNEVNVFTLGDERAFSPAGPLVWGSVSGGRNGLALRFAPAVTVLGAQAVDSGVVALTRAPAHLPAVVLVTAYALAHPRTGHFRFIFSLFFFQLQWVSLRVLGAFWLFFLKSKLFCVCREGRRGG